MATYIPNSATILSVYPIHLEETLNHNGWITYRHPAADKDSVVVRSYNPEWLSNPAGPRVDSPQFTDQKRPAEVNTGYAMIRVFDTFVWTRDFTQDAERYKPNPVNAVDVARDLVSKWAGGTLKGDGGSRPGLMVIAGEEPTVDEVVSIRQMQTSYFRTLVNDGHTLFSKGQVKDISDLHRSAARWLGANNLPWLPKIEQTLVKKCVACGNEIRQEALRCEHCSADLPDFYAKYGIEPDPLTDPTVAALMLKMPRRGKAA